MSITTLTSAPGPFQGSSIVPWTDSTIVMANQVLDHKTIGNMQFRLDAAHSSKPTGIIEHRGHPPTNPPAPMGLQWTDVVSHVPMRPGTTTRANPASMRPSAISQPKRSSQRSVSEEPALFTATYMPAGITRQRFYPEQWRRAVQSELDQQVQAAGQRIQWIGWDRSLPRLYLSSELLTQVIVGLLSLALRKSSGDSEQSDALSLRVGCQSGAHQAVVIVLEDSRLQLSLQQTAAINSPPSKTQSLRSDTDSQIVRILRTVHGLGASVFAQAAPGGGTIFRLSLPVDDRLTLVRGWMERIVRSDYSIPSATAHELATPARGDIALHMFLLGRKSMESASMLNSLDSRLQTLASEQEFVYRAARGRWIWLTTSSELPRFISLNQWFCHHVDQWVLPHDAASIELAAAASARLSLARVIASAMERMLGRRVPPLDTIDPLRNRQRQLRLDHASELPPVHRSNREKSIHGVPTPAMSKQRRWRYPI